MSVNTGGRPAASPTTFDHVTLAELVKNELPPGSYVGRDLGPPWTVPKHIAEALENVRPDDGEVTIIRVLAMTFPRALVGMCGDEVRKLCAEDPYGVYASNLGLVDEGYLTIDEVLEACAGPDEIVWVDDYG
jgi:hypothetical protein